MYNFKASIDDVTIRHEITKVQLGLKFYDFYFDGSENLGHSHTQLCMVQLREIGGEDGPKACGQMISKIGVVEGW